MPRVFFAFLSILLLSCDRDPPYDPAIDPTEYVYEVEGSGSLVMAGSEGTVHPFVLAFAISSNPDFHVPSSFASRLRVYAYFEDSPLCLFLQLEFSDGSWRAAGGPEAPYFHVGYGPYPDAYVESLPYHGSAEGLLVGVSPADAGILRSLSFSSGSVLAYDPAVAGYGGAVASVAVALSFSEPLGYAAVDYGSREALEAARFMDTRFRLAAVSPALDLALREDPVQNAPLLVETLTMGLTDPFAKARVIHDWIAGNLYYDHYWFETYYLPDPTADTDAFTAKSPCAVLKRRICGCGGYAQLFWYLCRLAGLHAPLSRGYVRSPSEPSKASDHTWNIMKCGSAVFMVDSTADSSNAYTTGRELVPGERRGQWFLPDPRMAGLFRWPYEAAHRGEGEAPTGEAFYALPMPLASSTAASWLGDGFFARGLSFDSAPRALYDASAPFEAGLSASNGVWTSLMVDAVDLSLAQPVSEARWAYLERDGASARLVMDPPHPGYYCFRVWAVESDGADGTAYTLLARLVSLKAEGSAASAPFPRQYRDFFDLGARLVSPARDCLVTGRSADFEIALQGAESFYTWGSPAPTVYYAPTTAGLKAAIVPPLTGAPWNLSVKIGGTSHALLAFTVGGE